MDQVLFYHHWKNPVFDVDYSIWLNTDAPVKLVAEQMPERVVCKDAPHVHWCTPSEFARMRAGGGVWIELPTRFHAPVCGALRVPRGCNGVAMAVFEFDWVYYTKNDPDIPEEDTYRIPPHEGRLENRMADRQFWVDACIRPSWSYFLENLDALNTTQKRILVGFSRVLREKSIVAEVSPLCGWAQEIVDYDRGLVDNNGWVEARLEALAGGSGGDAPGGGAVSMAAWHGKLPAYRWVLRDAADEDHVFQLEVRSLLRGGKTKRPVDLSSAFDRLLQLENTNHFFTQECVEHFPRLTALPGCEKGTLPSLYDDPDFVPSSPSIAVFPDNPHWYIINNRKVNYRILPNGPYVTIRGGQVNPIYNGISRNEFFFMDRDTLQPVSPIRPMSEEAIPGRREEEIAIVGLEDVRLVREGVDGGVLRFYATTKSHSYSDAIRIMTGRYDVERAIFCDTQVLHPPYDETPCEKNWVWCGDNRYIYRWHPVEIGSVRGDRLVIDENLPSPAYFKEFRGSSAGVVWRRHHFFTVHSVAQRDDGRKYAHSLVILDLLSETHRVVGVSPPFCFEEVQIEYNIGLDIHKGKVLFLYSTRDSSSRYIRMPLFHLLDQVRFISKDAEMHFKTAIYDSDW